MKVLQTSILLLLLGTLSGCSFLMSGPGMSQYVPPVSGGIPVTFRWTGGNGYLESIYQGSEQSGTEFIDFDWESGQPQEKTIYYGPVTYTYIAAYVKRSKMSHVKAQVGCGGIMGDKVCLARSTYLGLIPDPNKEGLLHYPSVKNVTIEAGHEYTIIIDTTTKPEQVNVIFQKDGTTITSTHPI